MSPQVAWRSISAALFLSAFVASPVFAEEANGRYALAPVEGGIAKLDTRTGAVSECHRAGEAMNCVLIPDERQKLQDEIDRLTRENSQLKAQLGSNNPPSGGDTVKPSPSLPSDAELERALSLMDRFLRRFKDIIREQDDGTRL